MQTKPLQYKAFLLKLATQEVLKEFANPLLASRSPQRFPSSDRSGRSHNRTRLAVGLQRHQKGAQVMLLGDYHLKHFDNERMPDKNQITSCRRQLSP